MKNFKKEIIATLTIISIVFGVYFWQEKTYAKNDRVELIAMRLEQKIVNDELSGIQERIWKLEDRFECVGEQECLKVMPQTEREEYRNLLEKKKKLEEELKKDKYE